MNRALPVITSLLVAAVSAVAQGRLARPKLIVICAVDQLATWVFDAGAEHFADDGGFRRLQRGGASFPQCAYDHGCTETGPGHATIGTGVSARLHGIVKNEWYDRERGAGTYCAGDVEVAPVPGFPEGKNRSPARLLVPTLGDLLKRVSPASKVVSVAHKDRSAILMAGAAADAVVWFENATGRFVTNSTWGKEAPGWLLAFDATKPADQFFGWTWERMAGDAAYQDLEDDRPFEAPHATTGKRTLPAVLTGGRRDEPSSAFYFETYVSPVGNELVLRAALAAMRGEALGQDAAADLLFVSFSANDTVGHYFGADSVEARDTLLRLDEQLGRLLTALDAEVGKGLYAVVLTADHGVGLTPESAKAQGLGGGRALLASRGKAIVQKDLRAHYGVDGTVSFVRHAASYSLYLDHEQILACAQRSNQSDRDGTDPAAAIAEASRVAAAACKKAPGIAAGFSVPELLASGPGDDPIRNALWHGVLPGRSGDVVFVPERYWIEAGLPASHGTPYGYDREVPLLALGAGLRRGHRSDAAVTPGLAAVLAAHWLGIEPPAGCPDELPSSAFEQ